MMQIYLSQFPHVNKDIWKRAKDAGFKALCLTTDTQIVGKRERDVRLNFTIPKHLSVSILEKYNFTGTVPEVTAKFKGNNEFDWTIIKHMKEVSGLPVIPKGISNYDDTIIALEHGADGIFLSNHGARQLDTTPGTIECLPEVVRAVRDSGRKVPIFFDGGVRKGSDVLKALALGADVVMIGRPVLYGLACDGQNGIEKVLSILNDELKEAMLHTGCMNISDAKNNSKLIYGDGDSLFTNSFGMRQPKL